MRLSEASENFLTALRANNRSPHTVSCYRRDLRLLVAHAGDVSVSELTPDLLNRFVLSDAVRLTQAGAPKNELSVGRTKAALRSFGRYLDDVGALRGNPARGLQIRRTERKPPAYLTEIERKRVLRALNARNDPLARRDRTMLAVFLGTGIRLAELTGLNVADVDLDRKHLTVRVKGGRTETRFLQSALRTTLRRYLRWRATTDDDVALFLSSRVQRISDRQVQERCHIWFRQADVTRPGLSVHSLRHTFGTRLHRRTRDLVLVGKAMGHRSVETTRVYTHVDEADLEEALEAL